MKKKEEPNMKNILFYLIIIIIVCLCLYLLYSVRNGSMRCMANPLSYGVSNLASSNGNEITCQCSFAGSSDILYVTKDNVSIISMEKLIK